MRAPNRFILTLNGGSSSIKLALFEADTQLKRVLHRGIDRLGTKDSQLVITGEWAECPGSIHEGGELGYSLSHSFGAAFEQPFYTGNTGHFRLSRANHSNIHVRGYKEEGTITTPFDMTVLNDLDRFHLAIDVIDRVSGTGLIDLNGEDLPEVRNWRWS